MAELEHDTNRSGANILWIVVFEFTVKNIAIV
jgi:hypothetical protein